MLMLGLAKKDIATKTDVVAICVYNAKIFGRYIQSMKLGLGCNIVYHACWIQLPLR
jgi:hypothetical protein